MGATTRRAWAEPTIAATTAAAATTSGTTAATAGGIGSRTRTSTADSCSRSDRGRRRLPPAACRLLSVDPDLPFAAALAHDRHLDGRRQKLPDRLSGPFDGDRRARESVGHADRLEVAGAIREAIEVQVAKDRLSLAAHVLVNERERRRGDFRSGSADAA